MADKDKKQDVEKTVKCVVVNGFSLNVSGRCRAFKRGDVIELSEKQAKDFGEYPKCLPRDVHVKPLATVSKDELADLNTPNKGNPAGVNKKG